MSLWQKEKERKRDREGRWGKLLGMRGNDVEEAGGA